MTIDTAPILASLSPEAQRTIGSINAYLDGIPADRHDLAILGLECLSYAGIDKPLPDDIKSAQYAAAYERGRLKKIALGAEADRVLARHLDSDDNAAALGVPIGEIAGETVYGDYSEDGNLFGADLHWNGLDIRTDGQTYLGLGTGEECDFHDQMTLPEWGKVKELAQTNVIEQLLALVRSKARLAVEKHTALTRPPA